MNNPALEKFDISEYTGTQNFNFFASYHGFSDLVLDSLGNTNAKYQNDVIAHLHGLGQLAGSILNTLTEQAHREGKFPELVQYDKTGNRIDEIRYCGEQKELRKILYEYGVVNIDKHPDWKHEFSQVHRMALAILVNMNGEMGVSCPLAMTEGLIHALNALGSPDQKDKYLTLLTSPSSTSHFMAGQYVTERVGGSNVGVNRTVAGKAGNGKWLLNGEKWFCSNPGDLWVTTGRIEHTNTIGMFLVSRFKEDGSLNGCKLLRKKDIIGSKGKLTAEAVYEDCEAEEIGRPGHGLAYLIKYILKTSRLHVICGSLGMSARAVIEAKAYTAERTAYGHKLSDFVSVQRTLSEMQVAQFAFTAGSFRIFSLTEKDNQACNILVPLFKTIGSQVATSLIKDAIILHGGNGILNDFSCLPRLLNDSIINETWEGAHAILMDHALSSCDRPRCMKALESEITESVNLGGAYPKIQKQVNDAFTLYKALLQKDEIFRELNRDKMCRILYSLFNLAQLLRFCANREKAAHGMSLTAANRYVRLYSEMCYAIFTAEGVFENTETLLPNEP